MNLDLIILLYKGIMTASVILLCEPTQYTAHCVCLLGKWSYYLNENYLFIG